MIERAEHSPIPIRKTKAIRLGRIASNAGQLPDGTFSARHRKITVDSAQDTRRIVVDKFEGEDTTWRTTIDITYGEYDVPFIAASRVGIVFGDIVTDREYSAAKTLENNDLMLYEVARAVRVAGRLCIEPNMVAETV